MTQLAPLGEFAWLARFSTEVAAQAWASAARTALEAQPAAFDVVLAYQSVAVFADSPGCHPETIEKLLRILTPAKLDHEPGPLIPVPVLYDGDDLPDAAIHLGCSVQELIAWHSQPIYTVYAVGFLPGFPYCGYLSDALAGLPRRAQPRTRVPAGSVAIAGRQTGIYPQDSPGGWHLLGRTPLTIVDLAETFFPIRAGDRIQFQPINAAEFAQLHGQRLQVNRPC